MIALPLGVVRSVRMISFTGEILVKGCKSLVICTLSFSVERAENVLYPFILLFHRCLSSPVDR